MVGAVPEDPVFDDDASGAGLCTPRDVRSIYRSDVCSRNVYSKCLGRYLSDLNPEVL